jgi:hypothetical protein
MSLVLIAARQHMHQTKLAISETVAIAILTAVISYLNIFMR